MKNILLLLFVSLSSLNAQTVNFESFELNENEVLIDAPDDQWVETPVSLPNGYDMQFDFYFNWFISSMTDTSTPGFQNQYSAITGAGNNGSQNYAIDYNFASDFSPTQIIIANEFDDIFVEGMYLTNSTYAYLSMLNGDSFAKKFGGESGDDPDYFYLSFRGVKDGIVTADSLIFYLANFQFEDNSLDYIVNEWTYFDVSSLGQVDEYQIQYFSSDSGAFGINTPTYFCMDDIQYSFIDNVEDETLKASFSVAPNPCTDVVTISTVSQTPVILLNASGQQLYHWDNIDLGENSFDIANLQGGIYILRQGESSMKLVVR